MRFDMSMGGMGSARQQAVAQSNDVDGDARLLAAALDQAARAVGGAPLGPRLTSLAGDAQAAMQTVNTRVHDLIAGSAQATGAYEQGDQAMAGNASRNEGHGNYVAAQFGTTGDRS